ncbi:hypothetical protein Q9299_04855 [Gemmobacter fulvus]|uniref:hypothetical protein n=1 Tax=Gemmobacter fulvus TaxID=2840474 RepID=UPI002796AB02|nr:hypothetical protein [Gemmobacter fulvus]MDQ1847610.1 hypothetical protein [Gemmobacter fulvus]
MMDLIASQVTDPFRIGLIIALIYTALRTRAATGMVVPLLAGIVFVAVIIPATAITSNAAPFWTQVATGVAANAALLLIGLGIWMGIERARR